MNKKKKKKGLATEMSGIEGGYEIVGCGFKYKLSIDSEKCVKIYDQKPERSTARQPHSLPKVITQNWTTVK